MLPTLLQLRICLKPLIAALLLPLGPIACNSPNALNSLLTRDQLNTRINANFHTGMTYQDVNAKLTQLRVSEGTRHTYAPTPPREMLVRLLPPGGAWVTESDQLIEWWDVTFSFDPQDRLAAARALNGGARYVDGFAANINPPLPPGVRVRYPQPVPPPSLPPAGDPIPLGP
jgi:hypothetical protein